jgi:hypothetical protein
VSLVKSFIEQLTIKLNIFIQEKKSGVLITSKTEDQFFNQIVYELFTVRPEDIVN